MSIKIRSLERRLKEWAKRVQAEEDLTHHRGQIGLLFEEAATSLRQLHDDYDALVRQGSDHA